MTTATAPTSAVHAEPPLLVVCLCAAWCGSCRDYTATFAEAAESFGGRARFMQLDIEDEAALLDGIEVENFPTLLIARGDTPLFFGPVTPHPQTLIRLVDSALAGDLRTATPEAAVVALPERLRRRGGARVP
jgi:thioredoxin 1